jgi:hypothetical protein
MDDWFDAPLPHADTLAAVRKAGPDRMANGLRAAQFAAILDAHPDVRVLDARDEERREREGM